MKVSTSFRALAHIQTRWQALLDEIVPCPSARQTHAFPTREFRHFVRGSVPAKPIKILPLDNATLKIGLGWRARDFPEGSWVEGRKKCTAYLNQLVERLTGELLRDLRQFSRQALVDLCLMNYESASNDRDRWRRTAAAVEALKNDKEAARRVIVDHEHELNAALEGSRIIAEMALAECSVEGGRKPGRIDLSRLMTQALQIMHLGGCSDAIHWEAMEPRIKIAPLGDVLMNLEFHEHVLESFGRTLTAATVQNAIGEYPEHYAKPKEPDDGPQLDPEFLAALNAEWGVSLDDVLTMLTFLEELGLEEGSAIVKRRMSDLLEVNTARVELGPETVHRLLETFSSKPRGQWDKVGRPYDEKDVQLWRFKRRLSLLRKPLIQLDSSSDPLIAFAPGMVREALNYQVRMFYHGELSYDRLFSREMKILEGGGGREARRIL